MKGRRVWSAAFGERPQRRTRAGAGGDQRSGLVWGREGRLETKQKPIGAPTWGGLFEWSLSTSWSPGPDLSTGPQTPPDPSLLTATRCRALIVINHAVMIVDKRAAVLRWSGKEGLLLTQPPLGSPPSGQAQTFVFLAALCCSEHFL